MELLFKRFKIDVNKYTVPFYLKPMTFLKSKTMCGSTCRARGNYNYYNDDNACKA